MCVCRTRALPAHARAVTVKSLIFDPRPKTGEFNRFAEGQGKQKSQKDVRQTDRAATQTLAADLMASACGKIPALSPVLVTIHRIRHNQAAMM